MHQRWSNASRRSQEGKRLSEALTALHSDLDVSKPISEVPQAGTRCSGIRTPRLLVTSAHRCFFRPGKLRTRALQVSLQQCVVLGSDLVRTLRSELPERSFLGEVVSSRNSS